MRLAAAVLMPLAALVVATVAHAASTGVVAGVDDITDSQSRTDGGLATSSVSAGSSVAGVEADLTHVHVFASDTTHYAIGAPGSGGQSDFYFELQGATGLVDLDFNFTTTGGFFRDESSFAYTSSGHWAAALRSGAGPWPYINGDLIRVKFGGALGGGAITMGSDFIGPGSVSTIPWDGENPGPFTLHSTFLGGQPSGGQLHLSVFGGGGNSHYDFELALRSITTPGSAEGLSLYVPDTGQRFEITSSGSLPEPAGWALMITGFGLVGGAMRRRLGHFARVV